MDALSHTALSSLLLLGIMQGWIMGVGLLLSKGRKNGSHYLAFAILAFSLTLLRLWSHMTGLWQTPGFWLMPLSFDMVIIILFWLYALSFTAASRPQLIRHRCWLVLWGIFMLYAVIVYAHTLSEPNMEAKSQIAALWRFDEVKLVEDYLTMLLNTFLGVMIWLRVSDYSKRVTHWIPEHRAAHLTYMRVMLLLLLAAIVINIISFSARELFEREASSVIWQGTQVFYVVVIYVAGFLGFKLADLPQFPVDTRNEAVPESSEFKEPDPTFSRLESIMQVEALFTDPDLNLNDLAKRIELSASMTGQLIRNARGQNFRSYVNAYRIDAVKSKLGDAHYASVSILAIALESGFNSESSFYRVFKAATGRSPKDFRKNSDDG